MNGVLVMEQDDYQIPKKGDIITALNPVQLYNTETGEVFEGSVLEPGEKARVVSVRIDQMNNAVWVILRYPEM